MGRLIKYSHHTGTSHRRLFARLSSYSGCSFWGDFLSNSERFALTLTTDDHKPVKKIANAQPPPSTRLNCHKSHSHHRSGERFFHRRWQYHQRQYFSITLDDRVKLFTSVSPPRCTTTTTTTEEKNKLKYDSERENKQTTGWRSALKGNAPFNESLKLEVETQYRIWKPPPAAENELRTPTNEKLLAKKLLPPSSTFVESGRLLCFAESVVYTQWNEYLQLAVET